MSPPKSRKQDIFDAICQLQTMDAAWDKVRGNAGCAGGDGETIAGFQRRAARRLNLLSRALLSGEYRPRDLRIIRIAKSSGGTRPLAIPSIEDRVAQTACATVLTPILDPTFEDSSFAYRPGRSVLQAVRQVQRWQKRGFEHVVEADIVRCFERIPHAPLLDRLDAHLSDQIGATRVSDLVAHWLEHAAHALDTPGNGLPQGSPLSPLLANLYLDQLDEEIGDNGIRIVRFADDFVLLCRSRRAAEAALQDADTALAAMGLELRDDRTRIIDFDRGFEFLGHLFVRSMAFKQIKDPEEDVIGVLRDVASNDADAQAEAAAEARQIANERARGYDRGERVLHITGGDRALELRNMSFSVTRPSDGREVIAVAHERVDRIEAGPHVAADADVLRMALATETDLVFVNGHGEAEGVLHRQLTADASALHLAQARVAMDPVRAAVVARALVHARLHNQRSQLHRLNEDVGDAEVIVATKALGRMIRKLPGSGDVGSLRGHEGAAGAVYWPALGRMCSVADLPFRRSRPAKDALNATVNYLSAMLVRDIRAGVQHCGLHPGFGMLHAIANRSEACVWDLIEPFRAPLSEGLAVTLFNQGRLKLAMFSETASGIRISTEGRKAIIRGYETSAGRLLKSPRTCRRMTWRMLMRDDARALATHVRDPDRRPFQPYHLKH